MSIFRNAVRTHQPVIVAATIGLVSGVPASAATSLPAFSNDVPAASSAARTVRKPEAGTRSPAQVTSKTAATDLIGTTTYHVPLAQVTGSRGAVTMKGAAPEVVLSLPLPALLEPVDVTLILDGAASGSLTEQSQLVVKVNERVVHQFPLKGDDGRFQRTISIPGAALKEGANEVRLVAAQRSYAGQNSCDAEAAPELWTQIDMDQSSFVVSARPRTVPARLDALGVLFDKVGLHSRQVVPVLTAEAPTEAEIQALGILAQGMGRHYGKTPLILRHATLPASPASLAARLPANARGAVVVGPIAKVSAYLEGIALPEQPGPIIAVRPLPGDPTRFVLVMAADDEQDLSQVATTFAVPGVPWPDEPWMQIRRLEVPNVDEAQRVIEAPAQPASAFPLKALQYRTSTSTGNNAAPTELRFWNNNWQGRLLVQVHLSYASGMAPQSALNVLTNGILHGSIPLNNPAGGSYFNYAVTVPAGSLNLGWNTLQFQPVLIAEGTGEGCKREAQENLAVTLYDDTMIQKYEGTPSQQSDLALLSGLGRPYIGPSSSQHTVVHLADADSQTLSAGLTLLAKIAQVHRGPLQPARLVIGGNHFARNAVWIGSHASLPPHAQRSISAQQPTQVAVRLPLVETGYIPRPDGAEWYASLKENLSLNSLKAPVYTLASLDITSSPGKKSYAYTTHADGTTTTVFTAEDRDSLVAGIESITEPERWQQLRGSFASWLPGIPGISTVSSEEAPFHAYGLRGGLAIVVSRYPWLALLALALAIGLLVPATNKVIKGYRKRYHGPNEK